MECGDFEDDSDLSDSEKEYLRETSREAKGSGILKAKMQINNEIPQYLPMYGQKVRLYYRGIQKTCTNCYCNGHIRKDCQNKKRQWISYVMDFMEQYPNIPIDYYGRWAKVVADELKSGGYKPPTRAEPTDASNDASVDEQKMFEISQKIEESMTKRK